MTVRRRISAPTVSVGRGSMTASMKTTVIVSEDVDQFAVVMHRSQIAKTICYACLRRTRRQRPVGQTHCNGGTRELPRRLKQRVRRAACKDDGVGGIAHKRCGWACIKRRFQPCFKHCRSHSRSRSEGRNREILCLVGKKVFLVKRWSGERGNDDEGSQGVATLSSSRKAMPGQAFGVSRRYRC